jgi:serine/threonine protein kinase/Tol biopolymer transport system component
VGLAAGARVGPYEVKSLLGVGGMGEVYSAFDPRLGREVAVKILAAPKAEDAGWLARFEREARAAAALNHANIVAVHDYGTDGGMTYLVAELLVGETLQARIAAGPIPLEPALDWARQIARGIAAAHAQGIVHRDLKPGNLFVTRDGVVKILDFGIAKVAGAAGLGHESTLMAEHTKLDPLTASGAVVGTLGYMSPEQVRGQPADARSDVFSFGAVIYELFTGQRAFQAATGNELAIAILQDTPPPIATAAGPVPRELERLVRRCLEKRPENRFQSARDVCFALESLASSGAAADIREASVTWRSRLVKAVGAVVLAAAITVVGVTVTRTPNLAPSPPPVIPPLNNAAQAQLQAPHFTRVTFTQDVYGRRAKFAPQEQTFLFSRFRRGSPSIYLGGIGSEESRPLGLENAIFEDVSPTGELLIRRYNGPFVWEGPCTLSRIAMTGGTPRDIASDVRRASWAPDGKNIAAIRRLSGKVVLEYPLGTSLYTTPGELDYVTISPRGDLIAFVEYPIPNAFRGGVAVVDLEGTKKQLTHVFGNVCCLAWAPDGNKIYFSATERGTNTQIWEVTLEGLKRPRVETTDRLLLDDVAADGRLLVTRSIGTPLIRAHRRGDVRERDLSGYVWAYPGDISEDGEWITIEEIGTTQGAEYKMYLRRTDGSPPILLGEGLEPRLSPDGSRVVAGSVVAPALIHITPTGAGPRQDLSPNGLKERWHPMWMPDGHRVIYSGVDARGIRRLYVQDVDGGPPRAFGPEGTSLDDASGSLVSPDGRTVAARDSGGAWILVALDGAKPRLVPNVRKDESIRQWTDDGRSLYVAGPRTDPRRIDKLDVTTGRRSHFLDVGGQVVNSRGGIEPIFLNRSGTAWVYGTGQAKTDLYVVELSPTP